MVIPSSVTLNEANTRFGFGLFKYPALFAGRDENAIVKSAVIIITSVDFTVNNLQENVKIVLQKFGV